jgi:DNA-directed RNA polymerase specialized sigma24 family protein
MPAAGPVLFRGRRIVHGWALGLTYGGMGRSSVTASSGFAATRWSMVLAAGNWRADSAAHRAMGELAAVYWFPLYAYVRRAGLGAAEAQDVVQGFFVQVLERDALAGVGREKGKFRSFLLASLKNYLANKRDLAAAQKRGGGRHMLSIDTPDAEARYAVQAADELTPERAFERRWAWALLDRVLAALRADYHAAGKGAVFEALKGTLTATAEGPDYEQLGRQLNMSKAALQVAAHRLRRRYRELLRREIGETVAGPELIDEEIAYLLGCL